jgi:hypothetical protein
MYSSQRVTRVVLALPGYAFYISLARRPILRDGVIPEAERS